MNEQNDNRMLRLLRELASLAEEASLTGGLGDGAPHAAKRYNAILKYHVAQGQVPDGLFSPLPDTAGYGQIGIESRMLAAFLDSDEENNKGKGKASKDASVLVRLAPFVDSADLAELVKEYVRDGTSVDAGVLTALAPFMQSADLGHLIRRHLSNRPGAPEPPSKPDRPRQPEAAAAPAQRDLVAAERTPVRPSLEDLSAQLRRPDLTQEERQAIAIQLAEIAHEQARFGA